MFYSAALLAAVLVSCENESVKPESDLNAQDAQDVQVDMSDFSLYSEDDLATTGKTAEGLQKCASMKNLASRLFKNKGLAKQMYDVEYNVRKAIALDGKKNTTGTSKSRIYKGPITIPVVVNIIEKSAGQVTQAMINSQIRILNQDYKNKNPNTSKVPSAFAKRVANANITFVLSGVNRVTNGKASWGTNDAMKKPSKGGIAPTSPQDHLNIWVCEIGGGILGYAQFPGGAPATDGVVIGTDFFGQNSAGGIYGKGRTATHEVGHWLNLRHVWGDGGCNRDDFVRDTPKSNRPNYNCPTYPTVHCNSADMTMNYMDYVQDDCMYMFTKGQKKRMRALFVSGGPRAGFIN